MVCSDSFNESVVHPLPPDFVSDIHAVASQPSSRHVICLRAMSQKPVFVSIRHVENAKQADLHPIEHIWLDIPAEAGKVMGDISRHIAIWYEIGSHAENSKGHSHYCEQNQIQAMRWGVFLDRDVAAFQPGHTLSVHLNDSLSSFSEGGHMGADGCLENFIVARDDQLVE